MSKGELINQLYEVLVQAKNEEVIKIVKYTLDLLENKKA
jgi:hypothetical protein